MATRSRGETQKQRMRRAGGEAPAGWVPFLRGHGRVTSALDEALRRDHGLTLNEYEVLLQLLSRYFAHTDESPKQLEVLADVSVGLMYGAIKPLGMVVTSLPVGPDLPEVTAGPGFELFY